MTSPFLPLDDSGAFSAAVKASNQSAAPALEANLKFFPGFRQQYIRTSGAIINTLVGGSGPPLLLLHGHPETHIAWHKVAGTLAKKFTVVLTDLRGYGDSSKPDGGLDHIRYSKREMGHDQIQVMNTLGFKQFQAVGHDRGGRVLFQMMLDHPYSVERAVVLDIAPTTEMYAHTNQEFATKYFWWFYHIQSAPLPECMINATPALYLTEHLSTQSKTPGAVTPEAYAEYLRCYRNPSCVHAVCEDYRASVTIDVTIEKEQTGLKAKQPLLVLWGQKGTVGQLFNVLDLWRKYAANYTGYSLPCGHLIPEEDPQGLLNALNHFLRV
ncbi:alpha/beta hydrolase [Paenibacillus sp. D2_2]|uniref:alpha/beta fold hydrolase n=1 Tax=Paenibacillus sp. D2_2 TaxID=3073092 RepID=UPI00281573C3|nr:alpha/beta hydrolase [Paenibacillus sp. D2_2]WMT43285.1 alpha/beta hydrolase [Paenibacillus sp. D2_2]